MVNKAKVSSRRTEWTSIRMPESPPRVEPNWSPACSTPSNRPRRSGATSGEHPGELLHLDVKKLARFQQPGHRVTGNRRQCTPGAGWDYVHVCVDDHSRVGFAQIYPDETGASVTDFLQAVVAYVRQLGVYVTGVMTDNGAGYLSRRFAEGCARLGLRHLRTRPYTPRTN